MRHLGSGSMLRIQVVPCDSVGMCVRERFCLIWGGVLVSSFSRLKYHSWYRMNIRDTGSTVPSVPVMCAGRVPDTDLWGASLKPRALFCEAETEAQRKDPVQGFRTGEKWGCGDPKLWVPLPRPGKQNGAVLGWRVIHSAGGICQ